MEHEKELLKAQIKFQSYVSKVDALAGALDTHQKGVYQEALRRSKVEYINCHQGKLDEELLALVDQHFQ